MRTPDSPPAPAVSALEPEAPRLPLSGILELLATPSESAISPEPLSWPPNHILGFIRCCDRELLIAAGRELGAVVTAGDWYPFERALHKQLEPLRREISRSMVTALTSVSRDSALTSIVHGGYQIHLDTMNCFWIGHPTTRSNLETLVSELVKKASPFRDEALNQTTAHTFIDGISTGTLDLPHFEYKVLKPEFITLTCNSSVRIEASRRVAQQQTTRG